MLEQAAAGSEYYRSKPGHRLLRSIKEKLAFEGLDEHSFEKQIRNDWRVQGRTFHRIFKEVVGEDLYAVAYGTFSESVHGSWQGRPQLLLARQRCRRFLAAVRAASRERRPRFAYRPVCHTALSRVGSKSPIGRPIHRGSLRPHFPSIVDIQCGEKAILL